MDYLRMDRQPDLRDPVAVVAFAGWNDAASAATNAARFIVRRLGARRFANIDPEEFYDFKEIRPNARIDSRGNREITWPANEFFYARNPTGPHDIVIAIGIEPNLRWHDFCHAFTGLFADLGVTLTLTVGALMADVPHTRPVRVTGSSEDARLNDTLNLSPSRYEGPTGIVGVLHRSLREVAMPAASLWANVPHYITTAQNPPATVALLRRMSPIAGLEFDLADLEASSTRFVAEVDTAIGANPQISDYVRRLEEASDSGIRATPPVDPGSLPPAEDIVLDVEQFLRGQKPGDQA
jgi:proteasome assembly chaperone (PAC2) family protein